MKKTKKYNRIFFAEEVLRKALSTVTSILGEDGESSLETFLIVERSNVKWQYDDIELFFADYRSSIPDYAVFNISNDRVSLDVTWFPSEVTNVVVSSKCTAEIEKLSSLFDTEVKGIHVTHIKDKRNIAPIIFIGHGSSPQWRDLKDHLRDHHNYQVTAYEVGSRAGHSVRDILEDMLGKSSFAILIMTGDDKSDEGKLRSRQNVVHEIGLFQGRLGFQKAIVVIEDGVEKFSNLQGIQQIRFRPGNIREVFGDVVAALNREFFDHNKE